MSGLSGAELVVLDARRFEEFHTMSIPRGRSVRLQLRWPAVDGFHLEALT